MKIRSLILLIIYTLMLIGCSPAIVSPTPIQKELPSVEVAQNEGGPSLEVPPSSSNNGLTSVYIDASLAPTVLEWSIPKRFGHVTKAYNHDDESSFDPVGNVASLRTQNPHLRVLVEGESITVQFDRDTFQCGRAQVDVSLDDTLVFSAVIRYEADCTAPPVPPPTPVPPTPPTCKPDYFEC